MKPPNLRHQVVIQSYTETTSGNSQTNRIFTPLYTVWAEIIDIAGRVQLFEKQIEENITHKITIRFHKFVTSENWILFEGRQFRIRNKKNHLEKNRWLILMCEENNIVLEDFQAGISESGYPLLNIP